MTLNILTKKKTEYFVFPQGTIYFDNDFRTWTTSVFTFILLLLEIIKLKAMNFRHSSLILEGELIKS